jgi:DNA helicase II / ATP-dependent DNA helicase PcrA
MRRLVEEEDWHPVDVEDLEPRADLVVRSQKNTLVVAGPGAGKTELLAQRASFLLDTGRCPWPQRILAVSFKRDAARNIEARVKARCGERGIRFDSFTLDAFAKRLVDRFLAALPPEWRPDSGYEVKSFSLRRDQIVDWLNSVRLPAGVSHAEYATYEEAKLKKILDAVMYGAELPYDGDAISELHRILGKQWWAEQLCPREGESRISFPMLSRLAAFLLRTNPMVCAALRKTYYAVFLDEFQDTTSSQWDLVRTAFAGSGSVLTAVGDSKQRIMVWAGAKTDIFERFQEDFAASREDLVRNYRSVRELVRIQHVIVEALEAGSEKAVSVCRAPETGVCAVLEFRNPEQEAKYLADLMAEEIRQGARPRDFCVIVRQRCADMVQGLAAELAARGITLRDESTLQDLRAEPVTEVVLLALRLGTRIRDSDAWSALVQRMASIAALDPESEGLRIEELAIAHKSAVTRELAEEGGLRDLPRVVVDVLGRAAYQSVFRQYLDDAYLNGVLEDLGRALQRSYESTGDSAQTADDFMGVDVVPAMTIHKSKGLEFGTIIFLGLEDSQWWSFRQQTSEEKRNFFVAFSRAIHRVLFTFCSERDQFGRRRIQRRDDVDALYAILREAGVGSLDLRAELG